jgi:hypothetical protein
LNPVPKDGYSKLRHNPILTTDTSTGNISGHVGSIATEDSLILHQEKNHIDISWLSSQINLDEAQDMFTQIIIRILQCQFVGIILVTCPSELKRYSDYYVIFSTLDA